MKIMLDECLAEGPSQAIIQWLALKGIEAHFLIDYFGTQGLQDATWAQRLKDEGDWYVITADRGRKGRIKGKPLAEGPPLPKILPRCNITAVYLSNALQQSKGDEKARAVISAGPQILEFFETSKPGAKKLLTKIKGNFRLQDL